MQIETTRFGKITVEESSLYHFEDGVPGFDGDKHFVFVPHRLPDGQPSLIRWMQCVEEGALAFPVVNPWHVRPDYAPTIPGPVLRQLNIKDIHQQMRLYSIITIPPDDPTNITINLLAPIVVNRVERVGRQVLVQNENYPLRAPLSLPPVPAEANQGAVEEGKRGLNHASL